MNSNSGTLLDCNKHRVTASSLNLRSAPSNSASIVASLPKGTVVEVDGIKKGWAQVIYGNKRCYLSSKYITITKQSSATKVKKKTKVEPTRFQLPGTDGYDFVVYIVLILSILLFFLWHSSKSNPFENSFTFTYILFLITTLIEGLYFFALNGDVWFINDVSFLVAVGSFFLMGFVIYAQVRTAFGLISRFGQVSENKGYTIPILVASAWVIAICVIAFDLKDLNLQQFTVLIGASSFALLGVVFSFIDINHKVRYNIMKSSFLVVGITGLVSILIQFIILLVIVVVGILGLWLVLTVMAGGSRSSSKGGRVKWGGSSSATDESGNEHTLTKGMLGEVTDESGNHYDEHGDGNYTQV